MKLPDVCTASTTHRRIVSRNPKALGATTSSRNSVLSFPSPRGRGQGEGEPNLPIKNHHESPVYRCLSGIIGFEISLFYSVRSLVAVCKDPSVLSPAAVCKDSSVPVISPGSNFSSVKWMSAKTHKSQTSLLCDARSHKSHIKSLNVNEFFCATSSHQRRNASNSKNSQNKKSLNVTDSEACLRISRSRPVLRALIAQKSHNQVFQEYCTTTSRSDIYNQKSRISNRTPPLPGTPFNYLTTNHTSTRNANVSCWAPDSRRALGLNPLATSH
jgi:hypothetical protein